MRTPYFLLITSLAAVLLVACKTEDPLYCDEDTPCTDPERPFCDLAGEYPASEGIGRTCIAGPDFAITAAPGDAQVRVGGELAIDITIDRIDGFPADITVEATNLPPGATAQPITIPGDSTIGTLLIQGGEASPGATATLTLSATAGPFERTTGIDLLVLGPPGTLDPTFGVLGLASEPGRITDDATFLAQLPDGSIRVGGQSPITGVGGLVGFTADGLLDETFGEGGRMEINPAGVGEGVHRGFRFAAQPDGKIVFASATDQGDVILGRLTTGGGLDETFEGAGLIASRVATGKYMFPEDLVVGPADEIVACLDGESIWLVRFTRDGIRDQAFGGGKIAIDLGENEEVSSITVLEDGAVVVVGRFTEADATRPYFVLRVTAQGVLDSAFGEGGVVSFDPNSAVFTALPWGDGLLIGGALIGDPPVSDPTLWKLRMTGELDAAFGDGGVKRVPLPGDLNGSVQWLLPSPAGLVAASTRL